MDLNPGGLYDLSPFEVRRILFGLAEEGFQLCIDRKEPAKILNAGRGNPNFLNTTVRKGYAHLCHFGAEYVQHGNPDHLGSRPTKDGISGKLNAFLRDRKEDGGVRFLKKAVQFTESHFKFNPDDIVFEWVDGVLGDYYPVPPRIFSHTEKIVTAYLTQILSLPPRPFQLFATEGATAAITYVFKSLKLNGLLRSGDRIGVVTPVYSPYLEIPQLDDYGLEIVPIQCQKELNWQIPDEELEKLNSPDIKALFLVNPGNPTAAGLEQDTIQKIARIIQTRRPDLLVLTDAVYATFADQYRGLIQEVPENTILIYSYSKYFGATGWRLGVILMQEDHVADRLISKLSLDDQARLEKRYGLVSTAPKQISFMERLVLDSRDIALAHTGGLSGPQQVMMGLMSIFHLLDEKGAYRKDLHNLLSKRMELFYEGLNLDPPQGKNFTHYYALVDLLAMARERYGEPFASHLSWNHTVFDFLCRLAKDKLTIALPGEGFGGPEWTIRVSLANLEEEDYVAVGKNIWEILGFFHAEWEIDRK